MKKSMLCIFAVLFFVSGQQRVFAQESKNEKNENVSSTTSFSGKKPSRSHWYLGGEFFSPHFFGDLYSITPEKWHVGWGGALKVGYQFSPVFALELNAGYGQNSATALDYQRTYMLGIRDAYMYYPYTMIDGVVYSTVEDLFGEQGVHNQTVTLEGISFDKIQSNIAVWQSSFNAVFNLNRLFTTGAARYGQPVELLLKPGIYLSRFTSTIVNKADGLQVAPRVNQKLTLGAGGDLAVRFNMGHKWALELTNRFIWERDRAIDGVLSSKRAYDDYTWQPAVALIYKLGNMEKATRPVLENNPLLPALKDISLPVFAYSYPKAKANTAPKQRAHSASISLTYPLNQTVIIPTLANNSDELSRFEKELSSFAADPDVIIRKIVVDGLASPEGPLQNNIRLSEGRASSIIEYAQRRLNIGYTLFSRGLMGENWAGLKEAVEKGDWANKKELLAILSNPDTEARKIAMKRVANYQHLLNTVYPSLRLSRYTVDYEIRVFDPQEARERIKTAPQTLSPEEMYSVALLYPIGSEEFTSAVEIMYTFYPESDLSLHLRGKDAFEAKDYDAAIRLLSRIKEKSAAVQNLLAVAYAHSGDTKQAMRLFRESAAQNDSNAIENVAKLSEYLNQQQSKK